MKKILLSLIAACAARGLDAVTLIYIALAVIYAVASYFYLQHASVPHATCAAMVCIFYLLLAYLHSRTHW